MRSDPYLWLHLSGIAAFPLFLQLTWLGLSIGDPLPFFWLEWILLIIVGILPVFWMQWVRPFDIYCLIIVALDPTSLSEEQRRLLSRFKTGKHKLFTLITAIAMVGVLWLIYQYAPVAAMVTLKLPQWRIFGLLIASISFLLANLFIQVPMSVLSILTTPSSVLAATSPYPPEAIASQFSILGFKTRQILFMPENIEVK